MPRSAAVLLVLMLTPANSRILAGQAPAVPNKVETSTVTVLTGLTVPTTTIVHITELQG